MYHWATMLVSGTQITRKTFLRKLQLLKTTTMLSMILKIFCILNQKNTKKRVCTVMNLQIGERISDIII